MKKEIPILMQTIMVQALINGRKTKTRRTRLLNEINQSPSEWSLINDFKSDFGDTITFQFLSSKKDVLIKCPYGKPGDILWVRETWSPKYVKGGLIGFRSAYPNEYPWTYLADDPSAKAYGNGESWKPSIHMPKDAARIWLEVTDVRIERVQDITEKDAIAEGAPDSLIVDDMQLLKGLGSWKIPSPFRMHQFGFMALWCKINGCESWLQNPWVWVISFKVLSTKGKPDFNRAKNYDFNSRNNLETSYY